MPQTKWKSSANQPSREQINEKVGTRIEQMLGELKREHGVHIMASAEQEFHKLHPNRKPIAREMAYGKIKQSLKSLSLLQGIHADTDTIDEMHIGTSYNHQPVQSTLEVVHQIEKARELLPRLLKKKLGVPITSFRGKEAYFDLHGRENYQDNATAGLHMNVSAWNEKGDNLFYGQGSLFSELASLSAIRLMQLQKDGVVLYTNGPESFSRFQTHDQAPKHFAIGYKKGEQSIALRNTRILGEQNPSPAFVSPGKDGKGGTPTYSSDVAPPFHKSFRIEDRLASADANPYLLMLADVGAIYTVLKKAPNSKFTPLTHHNQQLLMLEQTPIRHSRSTQKDYRDALDRFAKSDIWKEIAGESLHRDLVAYGKSLSQGRDGRA